MIFGGYMEPATTRVWSEMLADRKFANPIQRRLGGCPSGADPEDRVAGCFAGLEASRSGRLDPRKRWKWIP